MINSPLLKSIFRGMLNKCGYEIYQVKPSLGNNSYEVIKPFATFSPWNNDKRFLNIYKAIKNFTLVDYYRCFELWTLVEQCAKLQEGSLIEIGVWRGGTGAIIAQQAFDCGIKDTVFLCDTFTGVVKAGNKDHRYKGGEHNDTTPQMVKDLISKKLNLSNVKILEGVFPEETSHSIKNYKFRFCHIDVDVYQSAKDISVWIWEKMVTGGIIVYDDYGCQACDGITKFVEEQRYLDDRILLYNLNGHAIIIKIK